MPKQVTPSIRSKTSRAALAVRTMPYWEMVTPGVGLGYRRTASGIGRWIARSSKGTPPWNRKFAIADDREEANGTTVLSYEQAQEKAKAMVRAGRGVHVGDGVGKPRTVAEAVDLYEQSQIANGSDGYNAHRVRSQMTLELLSTPVCMLTSQQLRAWRDWRQHLGKSAANINRTINVLKAVLNAERRRDARVTSDQAWVGGLELLKGGKRARKAILENEVVARLVAAAYERLPQCPGFSGERDFAFGLLIHVAAVTGARISQIARIEVADLQADRVDPRILMPASGKGGKDRVAKKQRRVPVPITEELAANLSAAAAGRAGDERLLMRRGRPWGHSRYDRGSRYKRQWRATIAQIGLTPTWTMYALRHSSIVRQLLAGTPIAVVAANHDTSVQIIEANYAHYITDHSDALTRGALLRVLPSNVVPIAKAKRKRA